MADQAERLRIVDAHQHFWDLQRNYHPWLCDPEPIPFRYGDYGALRRSYLPPDYRRDSAGFEVAKTIHVEAEWDPNAPIAETRWLGEARRGEAGSMDNPKWRRGYALLERHGLSFDLQTPWWHLDAASDLARDFPATQIVINHTALPSDRSAEGLAGWRKGLETAAACPNVALKISGLGRPGLPWTMEANGPVIRDAIAIFSADRCLFASNYPVDSLAGSFRDIFSGFSAAVADRSDAERRKLFHDNAIRIYRL
jgi:predicted TIM-barrel fold metal-dependent hydrolase